jgi:O-antigen/teichoic acid export membrane protein
VSDASRQLPLGALYLIVGQGVFLLTGYLLHAFLARSLTPTMYGVFGVAMVVLGWAEITVNNGVPSALQKFLPDISLSEQSVRRAAARSQLAIGVAVFLALFLAAPWLAALLNDPSLTGYLRLAFVDILAMAAYGYYRGVLNGWRVFRQLAVTIAVYALTKLLAISILVYLGWGVQGALVGNVVASLGGLAAGFLWTRRRRTGRQTRSQNLPVTPAAPEAVTQAGASAEREAMSPGAAVDERTILAFVLPAVLFTLASNVMLGLDLMGVKALVADPDQVGYYTAAVNLANAPRLVLLAFSFALLPALSHAIAARDQTQTRHYLRQVIRLLALVLLPLLALVTATAEPLVAFVFTDAYLPAAPILTVLIFTYSAYTLYITLVSALLAENRPGRALAVPVALLPVALVLVWLGVTYFGTMGAAFASLVSVAAAATVVNVYVFRRFRPAVDRRSLARIVLASAVVWVVARLWAPSGLLLILAYALLGALYLGLLFALGEIKPQELTVVVASLAPAREGEDVRDGTRES